MTVWGPGGVRLRGLCAGFAVRRDGGVRGYAFSPVLLRSRLSATSSPGAEAAVDHSFSSCTQSRFSSSSVQSSVTSISKRS